MTRNKTLKRGAAVKIVYKSKTTENSVYGVVLEVSTQTVVVGHNFNSLIPVDQTRITLKSIVSVLPVNPQEYPHF